MIRAALSYAARGWPVFPVRPGDKRPLTPNGVKDATTDETIIRQWWRRWPDANVGIATGQASGIGVLDIDPRNGGDESLRDLEARYGPLPETVTALTGGGGAHYYFAVPPGIVVRTRKIALGLDLKGDGGYVVAPPSIHPSGRAYQWEVGRSPDDLPLTPLPGWLLEEAQPRAALPAYEKLLAGERVPEGERHEALLSLAGLLARQGATLEVARAAVRAARDYYTEPGAHPVTDQELEDILAFCYEAEARKPGAASTSSNGSSPPSTQGDPIARLRALPFFKALPSPLVAVRKIGGRQGEFDLVLADGRAITLGTISALTSQKKVREAIADAVQVLPPKLSADHWEVAIQLLLQAAGAGEDAGLDATSRVGELLGEFLDTQTASSGDLPTFDPGPEGTKRLVEYLSAQSPYPGRRLGAARTADGRLVLQLGVFMTWLHIYRQGGLSEAAVRLALRRLGFVPRLYTARVEYERGGSRVIGVRCWESPPNWRPAVEGAGS
jgi:hypothetical protein